MKTHLHFFVFLLIMILVRWASAEVYMTKEKCRISERDFSFTTNLNSIVEDGISNHKYRSALKLKGGKVLAMKPESEVDATPMSIGSSYTFVSRAGKKKSVTLTLKRAVERSSFSNQHIACGPVLTVKEYDVKIRGIESRPLLAKMTCDTRSVFVSSKCDD